MSLEIACEIKGGVGIANKKNMWRPRTPGGGKMLLVTARLDEKIEAFSLLERRKSEGNTTAPVRGRSGADSISQRKTGGRRRRVGI